MNTFTLWGLLGKWPGNTTRTGRTTASDAVWQDTRPLDCASESHRASGFDSQFDSGFDNPTLGSESIHGARARVIEQVLLGRADSMQAPYAAGYGVDATMRFDFRNRLVLLDRRAQRQLRVERELPLHTPYTPPSADVIVRELDETIWDLGVAAAPYRLIDQPSDWWHTPLAIGINVQIARYSRLPQYLEMARILAEEPATPSALRRCSRSSVDELRRFIQAGLMLNLLYWQP